MHCVPVQWQMRTPGVRMSYERGQVSLDCSWHVSLGGVSRTLVRLTRSAHESQNSASLARHSNAVLSHVQRRFHPGPVALVKNVDVTVENESLQSRAWFAGWEKTVVTSWQKSGLSKRRKSP